MHTILQSMTLLLQVLFLCLHWCILSATLLSKSELDICTVEDKTVQQGGTCQDTIFVTLVLHESQGESESLYANIHTVVKKTERKAESLSLENPYRITVTKSPVTIVYNLQYDRTINGKPREEVIHRLGYNFMGWQWSSDICGYSYIGKERIPYSDGYLCRCAIIDELLRDGHQCNLFDVSSGGMTVHCLKMNNIFYDGYYMMNPRLEYKISIKIESGSKDAAHNKIKWREVETFIITPGADVLTSKLKGIVARIHGDYATMREIDTFEDKTLFIPALSWKEKTDDKYKEIYNGGAKKWLIVPNSMIDVTGNECNKVGVSYEGFHNQDNRCSYPVSGCFDGQLWDLFQESKRSEINARQGQTGANFNSYYLENACNIDTDTSINNLILKCTHTGNHNTKLTLELNAANIRFVKNIADARIVTVKTRDFEALSEHGEINIAIENLGNLTSEYILSIKCPKGLNSINNRKLTLTAGEVKKIIFPITSYHKLGKYYKCSLTLWDTEFTAIDSKVFNIKTGSTCYCISTCGCTCAGEEDPICIYMDTELSILERANIWKEKMVKLIMTITGICRYDAITALISTCIVSVGCIKLSCGRVCICCKAKDKSKKIKKKERQLVNCTGLCRGALAAKRYVKLQTKSNTSVESSLETVLDWRAERFCCSCNLDQKDIMMLTILAKVYTIIMYPSYLISTAGRSIRMYVTKL